MCNIKLELNKNKYTLKNVKLLSQLFKCRLLNNVIVHRPLYSTKMLVINNIMIVVLIIINIIIILSAILWTFRSSLTEPSSYPSTSQQTRLVDEERDPTLVTRRHVGVETSLETFQTTMIDSSLS